MNVQIGREESKTWEVNSSQNAEKEKTQDIKDKLDSWLQKHAEQMIEDIAGLVGIESVAQNSEDGMEIEQDHPDPFGEKCREVLDKMLSYGERDGIKAFDHEGYCGSLLVGEGAVEIGIWNHLDVVPAGEGGCMSLLS